MPRPRLSELTDYDPMGNFVGAQPTADPVGTPSSAPLSNNIDKILNSIFRDDEKRLQLWPERLVREGITAAGDVASGKVPTLAVDPVTGDVHTSPQMIEKAQQISALAGTGGLASPGGSLNATPSLRPALKHNERLYKGKPGQEHQDIIPDALYKDFQKKAMSGEDLAEYNFGFINDKGHFLSREDALKYGIDNGLIDQQAGKFGTLTSTMFADSSKPGVAIEAMKGPNFFSALEHNVGQVKQGKMNGDAWLGTLSNKPGVKPEELDWTGLRSFLEENKGKPVTKAQIESHLTENRIELKDVVKGGDPEKRAKAYYHSMPNNTVKWEDLPQAARDTFDRLSPKEKTKYSQYQLPGGENYREVLMTLPEKPKLTAGYEVVNHPSGEGFALRDTSGNLKLAPEGYRNEGQPLRWDTKELAEAVGKPSYNKDQANYKSSHWDEPNIIAHMRMNDRNIDGKKSLHLEEIQSDWHQDGRKKGYALNDAERKRWEEVKKKADKDLTSQDYKDIDDLGKRSVISGLPPDAPFKKTWSDLALKKAIREAAENGYDRLSWTAGEHHPTNPKNLKQTGPEADAADRGMQGFYNDIIPKSIEKLGKEHGVKVKTSEINGKKIYYIDIPQSLRDTAMDKGFPLFSKGGYMLQPVDFDPFAGKTELKT